MQEEVKRIVIDEDGDTEWEDVEHEADEEPIPSNPESRPQSALTTD